MLVSGIYNLGKTLFIYNCLFQICNNFHKINACLILIRSRKNIDRSPPQILPKKNRVELSFQIELKKILQFWAGMKTSILSKLYSKLYPNRIQVISKSKILPFWAGWRGDKYSIQIISKSNL